MRWLQASSLSQIPGTRLLGGSRRRRRGGLGHLWQLGASVKALRAVDGGGSYMVPIQAIPCVLLFTLTSTYVY